MNYQPYCRENHRIALLPFVFPIFQNTDTLHRKPPSISPDKIMTYRYPASLNIHESGRLVLLFGLLCLLIYTLVFCEFQCYFDL